GPPATGFWQNARTTAIGRAGGSPCRAWSLRDRSREFQLLQFSERVPIMRAMPARGAGGRAVQPARTRDEQFDAVADRRVVAKVEQQLPQIARGDPGERRQLRVGRERTG